MMNSHKVSPALDGGAGLLVRVMGVEKKRSDIYQKYPYIDEC